jgi:hypothetical protein
MYRRWGSCWRGGIAMPFMGAGMFPWGRGGRWGRFFGPGEIRLALLSMLESGPKHGYELMKELETKSGGVLEIWPQAKHFHSSEVAPVDRYGNGFSACRCGAFGSCGAGLGLTS